MNSEIKVEKEEHHEQRPVCQSRAKYRQGRRLTAVRVYTINDESKYLIVNGVPAIKIMSELERLCLKYGDVEYMQLLAEYPHEEYTEVYLVKYQDIRRARFAKVQLDGKSFYGGVFHVCYAPELETVEETREKLQDRRRSIAALTRYRQDASSVNPPKKKRNKVLNPAAGRYLAHLKPELKSIYQDLLRTSEGSDSNSISQNKNFASSINSDKSLTCEADSVSKLKNVIYPNSSMSDAGVIQAAPQASWQGSKCNLLPLQIKRQSDFASASASSKKKLRVFGNKKILSYKLDETL